MKPRPPQMAAFVVLLASVLCGMPLLAGDAQQSSHQAELIRTLSGTKLGPSGFSTADQVKLEKGMIYDVWGIKDASTVVLLVDGDLVLVRKSDLRISNKVVKESVPDGFIPGRIVFRSAYYGPPDKRPRNDPQVLRILRSMVPGDEILKPVELLVTDVFLGRNAKGDIDKGWMVGEVDRDGNLSGAVRIPKPKKNVLVVEYQFNGEFHKKSALEESTLVLP